MNKAKQALIKQIPKHIEVRKFLFKNRCYSALLYSPGIYFEPPPDWAVSSIDFDTHEVWIKISFDNFKLN